MKENTNVLSVLWAKLVALFVWLVPAASGRSEPRAKPDNKNEQSPSDATAEAARKVEEPTDWVAASYEAAIRYRRDTESCLDSFSTSVNRLKADFAELAKSGTIPVPVISDHIFRMTEPAVAEVYRLARNDAAFMRAYKEQNGFSGSPTSVWLLLVFLAEKIAAPVMLGDRMTSEQLACLYFWKT